MRTITQVTTSAAVTLLLAAALAPTAAASTGRQQTCDEAGGVYTLGINPDTGLPQASRDRCVVTEGSVVSGPFGKPTTTYSDPVPHLSPYYVDTAPVPVGAASTSSETRDVGDAVVQVVQDRGTPVVESAERDAGDPAVSAEVVPGATVTKTHTVKGFPTKTETRGVRGCVRLSSAKAAKPVERCERTVLTTTTTPTVVLTTATTPQERVTTTTQPRETVTTTTTPVTEVSTASQRRERCETTTQPTELTRTTTQQTLRTKTVSYEQRTITSTTTATYGYASPQTATSPLQLIVFPGTANPRLRTENVPLEPLLTHTDEAGDPVETVETLAGPDVVTGPVCTETDPVVTVTEKDLASEQDVSVTPADPQVTVTAEALRASVTVRVEQGTPLVSTTERGTGTRCFVNPSTAQQRRSAC